MKFTSTIILVLATSASAFTASPRGWGESTNAAPTTKLDMTAPEPSKPTTFREAEVLGLRLMQEGSFEEALDAFKKAMKLPGSRPDVIRTKLLSGPSPVGGAVGGYESENVLQLDEFELQAAHYNMACAYAQLQNVDEAVVNLQKSFENGFNNFSTVRGDPDLQAINGSTEFEDLMEVYDPKKFNPFGMFKKK